MLMRVLWSVVVMIVWLVVGFQLVEDQRVEVGRKVRYKLSCILPFSGEAEVECSLGRPAPSLTAFHLKGENGHLELDQSNDFPQ